MKHAVARFVVVAGLVGMTAAPVFAVEEAPKTLQTLLIKGEVVSQDSNDPAAALLKVKDRYGFETPIYLTATTKIAQGDQTLAASSLTPGTNVEVEYNFDINTAKRQAVNVKVSPPSTSAAAPTPAVAPAATPASAAPAASPAPEASVPAASATPAAASAPVSAPSSTASTAPTQPAGQTQ